MNLVLQELEKKAKDIRKGILTSIGFNKKGHLGGSLSIADIIAVLYFYKMKIDVNYPDDPDRDRLIISKGHSVLAQYAALAELAYFPKSELKNSKNLGSLLQGHPEVEIPGVEANTGSLGQGLSIGLGMALGGKLDKRNYKVYVIMGDGELAEGQVWEAITAASFYKLNNLIAIVDSNKLQSSGFIKDRYDLGNLYQKFTAFGWNCLEIDGHNIEEIIYALNTADESTNTPLLIIANTIKGKGISFAENRAEYHNASIDKEQYKKALEMLK